MQEWFLPNAHNNSAFKLEKLGGAGSSCFSILWVAKEFTESI